MTKGQFEQSLQKFQNENLTEDIIDDIDVKFVAFVCACDDILKNRARPLFFIKQLLKNPDSALVSFFEKVSDEYEDDIIEDKCKHYCIQISKKLKTVIQFLQENIDSLFPKEGE